MADDDARKLSQLVGLTQARSYVFTANTMLARARDTLMGLDGSVAAEASRRADDLLCEGGTLHGALSVELHGLCREIEGGTDDDQG